MPLSSERSKRPTLSPEVVAAATPDPSHSEAVTPALDAASVVESAKDRCRRYVFPPGQPTVVKAFVRAVAFAKFGPGVEDGATVRLSGSRQPLSRSEERLLFADVERALLLDVYGGSMASRDPAGTDCPAAGPVLGDLQCKKSPLFHSMLTMTPHELDAVMDAAEWAPVLRVAAPPPALPSPSATPIFGETAGPAPNAPRKAQGLAESIVSTVLLHERRRRVGVMKRSAPRLEDLRTDPDVTRRQAQHFYNKAQPQVHTLRSWDDPTTSLQAMHRSAFAVCGHEERHNPAVTHNVRCLRAPFVPDPDRPGWDGFAALRGSQSGRGTTLRR